MTVDSDWGYVLDSREKHTYKREGPPLLPAWVAANLFGLEYTGRNARVIGVTPKRVEDKRLKFIVADLSKWWYSIQNLPIWTARIHRRYLSRSRPCPKDLANVSSTQSCSTVVWFGLVITSLFSQTDPDESSGDVRSMLVSSCKRQELDSFPLRKVVLSGALWGRQWKISAAMALAIGP